MTSQPDTKLDIIPLTLDVQKGIVHNLWGEPGVDDPSWCPTGLEAFFKVYESLCQHSQTSASSHQEIWNMITRFRLGDETREQVRSRLLEARTVLAGASDMAEKVDASIALAIRLWLMVDIGNIGRTLTLGNTHVNWTHGTIRNLISQTFTPDFEPGTNTKLCKVFTACNLQKMAGMCVTWTDNLADHLSLRDDDTRILIFHHATFLQNHQKCDTSPFPTGFLEETLRTLSLLIPPNDCKAVKWYADKQKELHLDPAAARCGHLNATGRQIENFRYWRDRLVILKQAFDEAEPQSLKQWWRDRRRRMQWYTFWIAVLVLVLTVLAGLTQFVFGVVQVWAAVKSAHR